MSDDFPLNSRYRNVPLRTMTLPDGREVAFVGRRVIPPPGRYRALDRHRTVDGDRLDQIAAASYGDPLLHWRIADANAAEDILAAAAPAGRLLVVPLPLETSGDG